MSFIVCIFTLIFVFLVYFFYTNFISILLQKLDLKLENFCLHKNFIVLNRKITLLFLYEMLKFILFFLSLLLFFSCTEFLIKYLYKLNSSQLLRAFFIAFIPYAFILYILFQSCLNIYTNKKISLQSISLIILLSYNVIFIGLLVEELCYVPFPNLFELNKKQN